MSSHYIILLISLLAVSSSAPVAKLSTIAALSLGFWRTGLIGLLLLPFSGKINQKQAQYVLVSGLFLAFHFWTWFESLHYTTAFRSTLLVCLNPFWVALWEWRQGTPPQKSFWIGGLCALVGVMFMTLGDTSTTMKASLWGDALATIGGMLGAAYFVVGKKAREELDIYRYGSWACLSCASWLGAIALMTNTSLLPHLEDWKFLLFMALGPQLCGHIGLNYVLKFVPASFLSLLLLFEPVGAGILAWIFLEEVLSLSTIMGGGIVILSLSYVMIFSQKPTKQLEKIENDLMNKNSTEW